VAVNVTCGVGARYESAAQNGISHLLEHMAFKGTKKHSARDIAEIFDNIGGQLNAYTSMELTVYYAKVLKGDLPLAVSMLGDILQHSTFSEEELSREREVIIQEIAMHHDSPEDLLVDYVDEVMFPNQPLGRTILGTPELMHGYQRDDLLAYMATHYRPERMVLSAAGAVEHDALVALAAEHFTLPASPAGERCPTARYAGGSRYVESDLEQVHLALGLPTISMHSPDFYVLQLYTNILGGGMSSRLFQEVREKRGLAYSVYASGAAYDDVGVMGIYAATAPDKASELLVVLCEEIRRMAEGISPAELSRAKNQMRAELVMSRESPQNVASWIGRHLMHYGEYRTQEEITRRIEAIEASDISRFAGQVMEGKLSVAALGNVNNLIDYNKLSFI
jgi:predicted Zn-dependent peptidase